MARCDGTVQVGARVDESMDEFLHAEADRLGITRAEVMRRIFDIYRDSREEGFNCPNCEVTIKHDLR